ncbi:MAG: dihydrodipicolinate synthase family protein [Candidatus Aminicenantales bacterium]
MIRSLAGVFAALTTPFEKGRISTEKLHQNIRKYNATRMEGYVVGGTTGEAAALSDEELETLVRAAREAAAQGKILIAGTGRESTAWTVELTDRMAEAGAEAALVRTPARMPTRALEKHYLVLADSTRCPIILYHIPQVTGVDLDPDLVVRLAGHPNIVGIKDSSGDLEFLGAVLPRLKKDFSYLVGSGSLFLFALMLGASGGILRLADVAPRLCAALFELFRKGKSDQALRLQKRLIPLNEAIIHRFGVPGTKYALDCLGYYGGPPRPPLLPLTAAEKRVMKRLLISIGMLRQARVLKKEERSGTKRRDS